MYPAMVTASGRAHVCSCLLESPWFLLSGCEFYLAWSFLFPWTRWKSHSTPLLLKPFFTFVEFTETWGLPSYRGYWPATLLWSHPVFHGHSSLLICHLFHGLLSRTQQNMLSDLQQSPPSTFSIFSFSSASWCLQEAPFKCEWAKITRCLRENFHMKWSQRKQKQGREYILEMNKFILREMRK